MRPSPLRPIPVLASLFAIAQPLMSQPSPPQAELRSVAEAAAELAAADKSWHQLLARSSLSSGIYRLEQGATDRQSPHEMDELYYVLSGRAKLEVGDKTLAAEPGALLFVAAHAPHRFVEITEDLTTLVFFSTAQPTHGGMAARPQPTKQQPFDEASQRGSARVFYWHGASSAGQLDIQYGRPRWQSSYERFIDQPSGRRWRFGENFWTTLDTNIPLQIGGVAVPVGQYYLAIEHSLEAGLRLVALDPQAVRTRRLDAYEVNKTKGGIEIPLTHSDGHGVAPRLSITLPVDWADENMTELRVRFGPHLLTAPIRMHP
ncbi:MAG: cupin domain-containing protein [Planctomycetota bacterium]